MKNTIIATLTLFLFIPISQAFSQGNEHSPTDIKLLKDSAAALTNINPGLSTRLMQFATKESAEREGTEQEETQENNSGDVQLLRDSATALNPSRPDLAKRLNVYADQESQDEKSESNTPKRRGY